VNADLRRRSFDTFQRATELPMLVLSLVVVPLVLAPLLFDLSETLDQALFVSDWFIWAIFAGELVVKTYLSPVRTTYLRQHWFDVFIVVVPFLRPLRIVRTTRVLRVLRALRVLAFAARFGHSVQHVLDSHGLKYAGGNIISVEDALWWAIATMTTVGYGDRVPVTTEGRAIAVFLMALGISLFSVVTASIAAFFVRPEETEQTASLEDIVERLDRLERLLSRLEPHLNGERGSLGANGSRAREERYEGSIARVD
jgi:voltage-gated potassium channel